MTPKGGLMVLGESQLRDNQNHPWKQLLNAVNTTTRESARFDQGFMDENSNWC